MSSLLGTIGALLLLALPSGAERAGRAGAEAALPQDPGQEVPSCRRCRSTGLQPCSQHPRSECELEHSVLYCSVIAACKECGGTGWLPCPHCENQPAREALERKRAGIGKHRDGLAELDKEMRRPLRKAESENFVLVWEMTGMKVGKKRLDEHEMLHLTIDRMERLFADYLEVFGLRRGEFSKKTRLFVWNYVRMQREGSLIFCGQGGDRGVKLMGSHSNYSVCGNKQFFRNDEQLHRNLVHSVTHLLFAHQSPSQWIGNRKGGWADAGLAHWFEDRYWALCDNYCYQEVATNTNFKGGKFKVAMRKMIAMDDAPPLPLVLSRNTENLEPAEHAVALSFVDYLIHLDARKFNRVGRMLRRKVETREALKDVYELGVLELERDWKAWVLETYPTR